VAADILLIAVPAIVCARSKRCHGTGKLGVHRKPLLPAPIKARGTFGPICARALEDEGTD
jgi:hypothetical protein